MRRLRLDVSSLWTSSLRELTIRGGASSQAQRVASGCTSAGRIPAADSTTSLCGHLWRKRVSGALLYNDTRPTRKLTESSWMQVHDQGGRSRQRSRDDNRSVRCLTNSPYDTPSCADRRPEDLTDQRLALLLRQPGRSCTSFSTDERLSHLEDRARSHSRPWSQHRQPPTATTTLGKIETRRGPSRNLLVRIPVVSILFRTSPRSQCIHTTCTGSGRIRGRVNAGFVAKWGWWRWEQ